MRSGDEAVRHTVQHLRLRPHPGAKVGRASAGDVPENATKGAEAVPAGHERNLGDGHVGVAEQRGRAFDPQREEVAMRRRSERRFERSREMRWRNAGDLSQSTNGPGFVRSGIETIARAQQPAQQCGSGWRCPSHLALHARGFVVGGVAIGTGCGKSAPPTARHFKHFAISPPVCRTLSCENVISSAIGQARLRGGCDALPKRAGAALFLTGRPALVANCFALQERDLAVISWRA